MPTTILVSPAAAALSALGDTIRFSAEVRDQRGQIMENAPVDWSTSDAMAATVDGTGLVTAVANGTVAITATGGAASATSTATIRQLVAEVRVSPAADTLMAGDTLRLSAEARDANGHRVGAAVFSWHSTDVGVATVDQGGLVRALTAGATRISAAYAAPQLVATATITVRGGATSASGPFWRPFIVRREGAAGPTRRVG
ncbi:Ig-like domain-containing protein [Candidatus Palauibacter sp.]|uniref:Ig-like domain-containing protein n=1 Tax=Candidatus Palauibacter sp. TaxID=3101350 RepID=UPI003B5254F5